MSQLQALREAPTETAPFNELATRVNGLPVEPRCRVCRNDALRRKVNALLTGGASYAMTLRAPDRTLTSEEATAVRDAAFAAAAQRTGAERRA